MAGVLDARVGERAGRLLRLIPRGPLSLNRSQAVLAVDDLGVLGEELQ